MDYHQDTKRVRSGLREAFKILRRRGYSAKAISAARAAAGKRLPAFLRHTMKHLKKEACSDEQ